MEIEKIGYSINPFGHTAYELECSFKISKSEGIVTYQMDIYFPEDYPDTKLKHYLNTVRGINEIFHLLITVKSSRINIKTFYVRPAQYSTYSLPSEKLGVRGMGKRLLCIALRNIAKEYIDLPIEDIIIQLDAGGGDYPYDDFMDKMTVEEAFEFLEDYPETYDGVETELENEEINEIQVIKYAFDVMENMKLVNYYHREYGFDVDNKENGLFVQMSAPLSRVLSKCG